MDKKKVIELLMEIKKNNHKEVFVYALEGCPACEELKKKLDNIGVVYEDIKMNGNEEMWLKLEEWGGSEYAPQIKVDGYLIKEEEYETVNELISKTVSILVGKKVVLT
jgi:glutaredoxin